LLGVGPERRRVGIGSALLDSWLEGVDHDRSPAYLETDRRQNLGFYGRAGFEILRENEVLGTRFWSMWRPAAL
jgi:ribosomal protein S18 acetylase RimI-like enzyme